MYTAYGEAPPDGWAFYLQNSTEPLPRTGTFAVAEGSVIVLPPLHHHRVDLPALAESLEDLYWSRDVDAQGLPRAPTAIGKCLVLSPTAALIIDAPTDVTIPALNLAACQATGQDPAQAYMVVSRSAMESPA